MSVNGSNLTDNPCRVYCGGMGSRSNLFVCFSMTRKIWI